MSKKHRHRTYGEQQRHILAVKIRKMTDEQLCEFVNQTVPAFGVRQYLDRLEELSEDGNGIEVGTVNKLRSIALMEGYIYAD